MWCVILLVQADDGDSDSVVMSLRELLQKVENAGMVDFEVGGHSCERPNTVTQGKEDGDRQQACMSFVV